MTDTGSDTTTLIGDRISSKRPLKNLKKRNFTIIIFFGEKPQPEAIFTTFLFNSPNTIRTFQLSHFFEQLKMTDQFEIWKEIKNDAEKVNFYLYENPVFLFSIHRTGLCDCRTQRKVPVTNFPANHNDITFLTVIVCFQSVQIIRHHYVDRASHIYR